MNKQEWRGRHQRRKPPGFSPWWILLMAISGIMIVAGLIISFGNREQGNAARKAANDLRDVYQETTEIPTIPPTASPMQLQTPVPTEMPETPQEEEAEALQTPVATPTPTPIPRLEEVFYPENSEHETGTRFKALQKENRDIIGWLTIGKIVDEPVVQRDNIFYMDHDVKGNKNVNGAIFLDEFVSLKTRPWGIILYGHNMRDGSMFGRLRNYEKSSFYRSNATLTFNTAYEEGKYVIFAAGVVDVENDSSERFLDIFSIMTRNIHERERAIEILKKVTPFDCGVDAQPEDQLILLVTCTGNESERRVVAARRIRNGEDEKGN